MLVAITTTFCGSEFQINDALSKEVLPFICSIHTAKQFDLYFYCYGWGESIPPSPFLKLYSITLMLTCWAPNMVRSP